MQAKLSNDSNVIEIPLTRKQNVEEKKERREHKSGSFRERADGTWEVRYKDSDYKNGKSISLYAKTEKEAKKKYREFIKEISSKKSVEGTKQSLEEYMLNWLVTIKKKQLKPTSYDRLEITLLHQIFPTLGWMSFSKVATDDIQELVDNLYRNGLSHSSVKKAYQALNNCYEHALDKYPSPVVRNPCRGVQLDEPISAMAKPVTYFSSTEVNRLVETATGLSERSDGVKNIKFRLGWIVVLVLNTGLRLGELLALTWGNDVDLDNNIITVQHSIVCIKNRMPNAATKYTLIDQPSTKTKSGVRTIHINNGARQALLELKALNGHHKYVVSTRNGKLINPRNIDTTFKRICRVAGLYTREEDEKFGMHSLRHTFASHLFAKGVDVKIVSAILGHSDVQITYDTYIHIIGNQTKKAIEVIDDIITLPD